MDICEYAIDIYLEMATLTMVLIRLNLPSAVRVQNLDLHLR